MSFKNITYLQNELHNFSLNMQSQTLRMALCSIFFMSRIINWCSVKQDAVALFTHHTPEISLQKYWLWPKTFHWTSSSRVGGPYVCPLVPWGLKKDRKKPYLLTRSAAGPPIRRADISQLLYCSQFPLRCACSQRKNSKTVSDWVGSHWVPIVFSL